MSYADRDSGSYDIGLDIVLRRSHQPQYAPNGAITKS